MCVRLIGITLSLFLQYYSNNKFVSYISSPNSKLVMENLPQEITFYLAAAFLPPIGPFVLGLIVFIIDADWVDSLTEKIEHFVRRAANSITPSSHWIQRNLTRPILSGFVWLSNWTDSFKSRGLKNAVRICCAYWAISLILLFWFMALYALVAVLFFIVAFYVLRAMGEANRNKRYDDY